MDIKSNRFQVSVANEGQEGEVLFVVDKNTGAPRNTKKNIRVEKLERFTIYIIDERTENEMVILVDDKNGNAYTTKQMVPFGV